MGKQQKITYCKDCGCISARGDICMKCRDNRAQTFDLKAKDQETKEQQELDAYNLNVIKLRFKDIEEELSHLKHWLKRVDVLEGQMANLVEEIVKLKESNEGAGSEKPSGFKPFTTPFTLEVGKSSCIYRLRYKNAEGDDCTVCLESNQLMREMSRNSTTREVFWGGVWRNPHYALSTVIEEMQKMDGLQIAYTTPGVEWEFVIAKKEGP